MASQPTKVLIEHIPTADPSMAWRLTLDDDLHCCAESCRAVFSLARRLFNIDAAWLPDLEQYVVMWMGGR